MGSTTSTGLDHSDQDDIHPCLWTGCDTSAISLDQLISHIRDIHIGSGKVIIYHLSVVVYIVLTLINYRLPIIVNGLVVLEIKNHF